MVCSSLLSVSIEKPRGAFGEVMNEMRSWLDNHKIQPIYFRTDTADAGFVAFEIRFAQEHEARLFEQAFSGEERALIKSGDPTARGNATQDTQPSGPSPLAVDDQLITHEL